MSTEEQAMEPEPTPAVEPDETPEVKAAAEAVRRAKEEFEKACATYENLRREAVDRIRKLRESTVGDVVEGSLETVRRHPALGVGLAVLVGFFLGRLFRR
ncbi:MAG: hypothetical protein GXX96_08985 [Planctomycetaceae bacterium]|jgi:ElaB/YqjD/DUF883 family membrane-anchored ribosome-binding protein|nr:hypothetical protein [Planctomycetaceae bacterium]